MLNGCLCCVFGSKHARLVFLGLAASMLVLVTIAFGGVFLWVPSKLPFIFSTQPPGLFWALKVALGKCGALLEPTPRMEQGWPYFHAELAAEVAVADYGEVRNTLDMDFDCHALSWQLMWQWLTWGRGGFDLGRSLTGAFKQRCIFSCR